MVLAGVALEADDRRPAGEHQVGQPSQHWHAETAATMGLGEAQVEHRIATMRDIGDVIDHGDADALAVRADPQAHGVG